MAATAPGQARDLAEYLCRHTLEINTFGDRWVAVTTSSALKCAHTPTATGS